MKYRDHIKLLTESPLDFIKEVESWGYRFERMIVVDEVMLELSKGFGESVRINSIISLEPKSGNGTTVMKRLMALAKRMNLSLRGAAQPIGPEGDTIPLDKLIRWYRKLGFEVNYETQEIEYNSQQTTPVITLRPSKKRPH